jgi:DNA-binding MarR family transcriptional regulator
MGNFSVPFGMEITMHSLPTAVGTARQVRTPLATEFSRPDRSEALQCFCSALLGLIRADQRDLTARQLCVLATLSLEPDLNTVRGLAVHLRISKPAITRAIDRLEKEGLVKRRPDPTDRRSVLLAILPAGRAFLDDIEIGLLKPTAEA